MDHLREHFAVKRGGGTVESLDEHLKNGMDPERGPEPDKEVAELERAKLILFLQKELKPQHREMLTDFYVSGLSYEEISEKHGFAVNSVGAYLKLGIETMRKFLEKTPRLMSEVRALLRVILWSMFTFR